MKDYILYGNGGHAKVIKEIIQSIGGRILAIYDENNPYNPEMFPQAELIIAIGNNDARKKIATQVHHPFATIIHPKAVVAQHVSIGEGTVVLANAVIQEDAVIGKHSIIQPNVTIDHDARVGDFSIIYPNSYVGGEASIPQLATVPPNSIVPRMTIFTI